VQLQVVTEFINGHPIDAGAALLLLTWRNASFRFFRSHTSSMIRRVSAGRSSSFVTESDSMSSPPACRASPVGADEKSSLNWTFSRLSLSRFMSYLPLLSFGPSAIVPGSAYLLPAPFSDGVPHWPCRRHDLIRPLLTSGVPTINQTVSTLRFFFKVTLKRPDIVEHTHVIHEPRKLPAVLSPEEVARLLDAASGLKYKAALSVAYGAGLRAAEVVALKGL
jgi:hypothetical protein